jgi:hypothetical protein
LAKARVALIARVARTPELRRVNLAFLGYSISEHATWLAVAFYALERGGTSEVGVAAAAQLLPGVLLTPFSSYAGDRFRPLPALAAGYLVQSIAMLATAVAMAADEGITTYVFGAIAATAISFTRPVMGSLLPTVTHAPADLVAANVVVGIIEQVGIFIGPLTGGVLMAAASPSAVFVAGGALTGIGAIAVATVRSAVDGAHTTGTRHAPPSGIDVIRQMSAGFAAIRASTMLRLLLALVVGAGLVRGVGDVVFVAFAEERLDGGGGTSGVLATWYGVGGLVAAAAATRLGTVQRVSGPFVVAGACAGASLVVAAIAADQVSAAAAFALMGAGDALLVISSVVTIQRIAPTDVLARTFGIVEGVQMGFTALGSYLVAVITTASSLGTSLVTMAAAVSAVVLVSAALLRRHGDEIPPVDDAVVDRLLVDPVFAVLPATVIERLAREADQDTAAAGTVIVREGDHGDRYYLIVTGEVAVTIGGEPIRTLGRGSSFGEIALLRDLPRTATATAVDDVALITVSRDEFLTTVTGHPRSFGAASAAADSWLGPR